MIGAGTNLFPAWLRLGGGTPPSTLLDGLRSYWNLDETSGTRNDSVGANHLTDNNTVGYDTGMHNNAAKFVSANAESLSVVAPGLFPGGNVDWSASFWVKHTGQDYGMLVGTYDQANGVGVFSRNNNTLDLYYMPSASLILNVGCTANVWHNVYFEYVGATRTGLVAVDDGAPVSGVKASPYAESTATTLRIGVATGLVNLTGLIDEFGVWPARILAATERTELWNAGAGKFYPF